MTTETIWAGNIPHHTTTHGTIHLDRQLPDTTIAMLCHWLDDAEVSPRKCVGVTLHGEHPPTFHVVTTADHWCHTCDDLHHELHQRLDDGTWHWTTERCPGRPRTHDERD